jgi:hypothetical protein
MSKAAPGYGTLDWHKAQIAKAVRGLLGAEGVIEDALDAVIHGAEQEYAARIIITCPAHMLIDGGGLFVWPEAATNNARNPEMNRRSRHA